MKFESGIGRILATRVQKSSIFLPVQSLCQSMLMFMANIISLWCVLADTGCELFLRGAQIYPNSIGISKFLNF